MAKPTDCRAFPHGSCLAFELGPGKWWPSWGVTQLPSTWTRDPLIDENSRGHAVRDVDLPGEVQLLHSVVVAPGEGFAHVSHWKVIGILSTLRLTNCFQEMDGHYLRSFQRTADDNEWPQLIFPTFVSFLGGRRRLVHRKISYSWSLPPSGDSRTQHHEWGVDCTVPLMGQYGAQKRWTSRIQNIDPR